MPARHLITPSINARGRHESESIVDPHRLSGGKRKGRSMSKKPRESTILPGVTIDNLKTARDNGGVYCPKLRCVIYSRKGQ